MSSFTGGNVGASTPDSIYLARAINFVDKMRRAQRRRPRVFKRELLNAEQSITTVGVIAGISPG